MGPEVCEPFLTQILGSKLRIELYKVSCLEDTLTFELYANSLVLLKAAAAPQSADSPVLFDLISNAIGTSNTNIFPTISLARSLSAIL